VNRLDHLLPEHLELPAPPSVRARVSVVHKALLANRVALQQKRKAALAAKVEDFPSPGAKQVHAHATEAAVKRAQERVTSRAMSARTSRTAVPSSSTVLGKQTPQSARGRSPRGDSGALSAPVSAKHSPLASPQLVRPNLSARVSPKPSPLASPNLVRPNLTAPPSISTMYGTRGGNVSPWLSDMPPDIPTPARLRRREPEAAMPSATPSPALLRGHASEAGEQITPPQMAPRPRHVPTAPASQANDHLHHKPIMVSSTSQGAPSPKPERNRPKILYISEHVPRDRQLR
jgi:hypothetical protein